MKYSHVIISVLLISTAAMTAEYTTNDWQTAREQWQTAREQWKAARIAWTNEMAKAAAAGLVPPRKAKTGNPKRRQPGAAALQAERTPVLSKAQALTKAQASYFNNRRICVGRDTTTLPGYVITEWHRNGKPDTKDPVVTNRLQKIVGAEQKNPIQELSDRNRMLAEEWKATAEKWRIAATNNAARVERATAVLDEKRAEYVEKRDKSALPTTKANYQAFIDAIDRIRERLKIEGGDN